MKREYTRDDRPRLIVTNWPENSEHLDEVRLASIAAKIPGSILTLTFLQLIAHEGLLDANRGLWHRQTRDETPGRSYRGVWMDAAPAYFGGLR